YVDRQVLSILAKTLETTIGWDSIQYGYITAAFQAAYAIGLLLAGRVIDRLGTRTGFAIAVTLWSFAAMLHAAAASAFTFGFARGKFLTDPIWWFYLFWFPKYLQETFKLSLTEIVLPMIVAYNASTVGSIAGGWLSGGLIKRGWSLNGARKTAMLVCALAVAPVMYAPYSKSLWVVVGVVSL